MSDRLAVDVDALTGLPATSGTAAAVGGTGGAARPGWRRFVRRFAANRLAVVGLVFLVVLVMLALFPSLFAPEDPNDQNLLDRFDSGIGLLGADDLGRDQASRIIWGARISLAAGLIVVGVSAGVGVPFGIVAGYFGGRTDGIISRVSEALQSVPALIFALTVISVLGVGLVNAMLAVGIVTIPRFFRVARAAALDVTGNTYIEASRAIGCSSSRIMGRHVLPNTMAPLVVQVALTIGSAITAEATLSFLGLGVRPPTSSWGAMLSNGARNVSQAPHLVYAPGVAIVLTVLAFMFVGDGLRQALGTRQILGTDD
jgi:peptide/nickel transport system permease protein